MDTLFKSIAWLQKNQFLTGMLLSGALGAAALHTRRIVGFVRRKLINRFIVSVMIESNDHAFDWVTAWLNSRPAFNKIRTVRVQTERTSEDDGSDLYGFKREYIPQEGTYVFWFNRKPVIVTLTRDQDKDRGYGAVIRETYWISYPGTTRSVFEKILKEGNEILEKKDDQIDIYIVGGSGWNHLESRRGRSMESVLLPTEMRSSLLKDFEDFLNGREWYEKMGIPYRRGYLLHGPPGTGKSSIVAALAGHFGKNIYILNMAHTSDAALRELLADVADNSIVLMEDVDSIFKNRVTTDSSGTQITFATVGGILNLLDGVEAREGRIIFMSANNVSLLPEAMTRPGRIDRVLYIGYANGEQIRAMVVRFFGTRIRIDLLESFVERLEDSFVTMARLQEFLLVRRDRPDAILDEIGDLLSERIVREPEQTHFESK